MSTDALTNLLLQQAMVSNPMRYAAILSAIDSDEVALLKERLPLLQQQMEVTEDALASIDKMYDAVVGSGYAKRRKSGKEDLYGGLDSPKVNGAGISIISVLRTHASYSAALSKNLYEGAELICGANIISFDKAKENLREELNNAEEHIGKTRSQAILEKLEVAEEDALKNLALEQQVNSGATTAFLRGVSLLASALELGDRYLSDMHKVFEGYYNRLRHRHTEEGIDIQSYFYEPCPVFTDAAIEIWDNLDKSGEIESGSDVNELSVYTINRAKNMILAIRSLRAWFGGTNDELIRSSNEIIVTIEQIRRIVIGLETALGNTTWKYGDTIFNRLKADYIDAVRDMELSALPASGRTSQSLSKTERFALAHRNNSIKEISNLLMVDASIEEITEKALKLKAEERKFLLEENSFFICRIGSGNPFLGIAPGAIEVLPGEKPIGNLDRIRGSGFSEMKEFIAGLSGMKKWAKLYLATSPSFSTDKSNVLLVGPQGCGKTELLRAVGADNDSISIFATGSDFLTCWLGEAQKNPKRLFEEALRLQKLSGGRDVNILIDEIDEVLSKDSQGVSNKVNLSTEFQNLMDGVVAYPGIRIWGATNHPERIPTPMLRRFARVEIVGEMDLEDRVETLKYYIENFLPVDESVEPMYEDWGRKLEGATGDILRKIADDVWRKSIRYLISDHEETAELIVEHIDKEYGDTFEVTDLTDEDRVLIKEMISEVAVVSTFVIDSVINDLLSNFAIKEQIATACNTYATAKALKKKV